MAKTGGPSPYHGDRRRTLADLLRRYREVRGHQAVGDETS
jgi:hypothetical protein